MKSMTCLFAIILVIAVGCDSPDERLVHQLAETSREVVEQNQEIAKTQHEIAEGSKQLVNAVAESRHEHNELQRNIQTQRDHLELQQRGTRHDRMLGLGGTLAIVLVGVTVLVLEGLPAAPVLERLLGFPSRHHEVAIVAGDRTHRL